MTDGTKRYGLLSLKKDNGNSYTKVKATVANVFGHDSDSDEESKSAKKLTAAQMFEKKYSSKKVQREIEKNLAEDPSVYAYDEVYDQLKRTREGTEEQKKADKDKKPKYVQNIIKAHQRRELQKLVHDEHVYKKDREKEDGMFDDKEAFVTESYRKKIAERNAFREEIERQDALDEMVDVKDQKMWQQAFHRKMLDDISSEPIVKSEPIDDVNVVQSSSSDVKNEPSDAEMEKPMRKSDKRVKEETKSRNGSVERSQKREHSYNHGHRSSERYGTSSERHRRSPERHRRSPERHRRSPERHRRSPERHRRHDQKEKNTKASEEDEIAKRMERIRIILARRNTEEDIQAARQRYFERQSDRTIVPPV